MQQQTFTDVEYFNRKQKSRRETFLDTMDEIVPWADLIELIRPYYPTGRRGRRPRGIETMLRMYLLQYWFGLSAAGIEDIINDSYAMRSFMHVDFLTEQVPDSNTLLRFRKLMEDNELDQAVICTIEELLAIAGLALHRGSISDASLAGTTRKRRSRRKAE